MRVAIWYVNWLDVCHPDLTKHNSGGGLGGLTLAITVGRYSSIPIDIYEATDDIGTVGAGLAIFRRTWTVFQQIGIDIEMEKRGYISACSSMYVSYTSHLLSNDSCVLIVVDGYVGLTRNDLVDMLKALLPSTCTIHTGKRLISYTTSDDIVKLVFSDGTSANANILVGADGIRSTVRAQMFSYLKERQSLPKYLEHDDEYRRTVNPRWTGTQIYRALIPVERLKNIFPDHPVLTSTAGAFLTRNIISSSAHIMAFPIARGDLVNFLGFVSRPVEEGVALDRKWTAEATKQEVQGYFEGWEPAVQSLLACLDPVLSRWDLHVMGKLPLCVDGRVALIGDAVHAMSTNIAAGAGQAMEDAYILGRLLAHSQMTLETVSVAFEAYQAKRLPFVNQIIENANEVGLMYEFNGPIYNGEERRDKEKMDEWAARIYSMWEFQWVGSPEEDWEEVKGEFERHISQMSMK
ncbi:FAD/NAD-P-binding domain-containing protein [Stereum hirsutum FP-91666 SS1]|uniref:FAD/NAD-P-binding domain-containing protein n=1 Tax=Stereum hirsutum (strain FP-91666) TaxID=721885 RepID=UPI000444A8B2|nr:FAD/NAD-P-binding domain-containing protein [Stereum hirsutum FP-91666 SS1]EIM84251.1 FAD/NAD-P-binding domain-containing protein [Stereum hirsutum FP-91666 SS1]